MLIDFYFFYATSNSYTISNELVENKHVFSIALTAAAVRDGALAGLLSEYRRRSNGQSPARHPIASNENC